MRRTTVILAILVLAATAAAQLPFSWLAGMGYGFVPRDDLLMSHRYRGDLLDQTGNGRNGTLVGTATLGPGYIDTGATGAVTIADFDYNTNNLSAFIWLKTTNTTVNRAILTHYDASQNQRNWSLLFPSDSWTPAPNGTQFGFLGTANGVLTIPDYVSVWHNANVADGKWHHVGFTYSGAAAIGSQILLYLDGAEVSKTQNYEGSLKSLSACDSPIVVGASATGGNAYNPTKVKPGRYSHPLLYGRTVPPEEVKSIFLEGPPND